MPTPAQVKHASTFLKLVSGPTCLKLLRTLKAQALCVCDLAAVEAIRASAMGQQLRALRSGRMVTFRKAGRVAYSRQLDHHVTTLIESSLEHARE